MFMQKERLRTCTRSLLLTSVLAGLAGTASAQTTWVVGPTGIPEIAMLFDGSLGFTALPGDTVLVEPGTYMPFDMGPIDGVSVLYSDPAGTGLPAIVDAAGSGTAVTIAGGESGASIARCPVSAPIGR